ncbi:C-C chemokine receptor type 8 [Chelonia mydas]|uniref:C-C chemokine receptor type 8 n=1 Tax=Chelonia mydas TaxID=8469 RepID=M7BHM0_CHEMY|nr:C-C chemokine receptor type 8 [Chelonia mydas]
MMVGLAAIPNMAFTQEVEIEQSLKCVPKYLPGQETWRFFTQFEVNILGLLIPLSILIYCYSHILKNLQSCKNRNKIKAIKLIFIIVVIFFLFWAPFNIVLFLDSLQNLHIINNCETSQRLALALQLTESISFIHCCLNPVIYAFAGEMFKAHLKKIFQTCIRRISSSNSANHSHSLPTQVLGYSDSDRVL